VADRALTGVLLVGGASRRFGSPKALARFRDETLAERAWAVLDEACDERLAVGKAADGLALPFPVLDDGSDARAPLAGLVAGLRAASHDVCVALPVDCPLMTPEALRALGEAVAVPQTGPLPGAYERSLLPVLEERLASGDYRLRGLNPRVLELDERLLANANTPEELARLAATADVCPDQ
jgi:molybdopterin-guanine dinucleotide biosynthesis protein A